MADLDSLIGCKISLISHQDIRYDGTLFSINQPESSIVRKDGKCISETTALLVFQFYLLSSIQFKLAVPKKE